MTNNHLKYSGKNVMENRSRVSDIKKKFECLNSQNKLPTKNNRDVNNVSIDINSKINAGSGDNATNRQQTVNGKCHIKRSNAFRSDKFLPVGVKITDCQDSSLGNPDFVRNAIAPKNSALKSKNDGNSAQTNDLLKGRGKLRSFPPALDTPSDATNGNSKRNVNLPFTVKISKHNNGHKNSTTSCSNAVSSYLKSDTKSLENNSSNPLQVSPSPSCNSLPETIKAVLKTPLPKGPPPKKPPRTFKHVVGQVISSNRDSPKNLQFNKIGPELKLTLSANNNVPFATKKVLLPVRSKTEPQLIIKHKSPLFDFHNKVPDLVPNYNQFKQNKMVSSNLESSAKPLSFLCSLNCTSDGSVNRKNIYDVPFESNFLIDLHTSLGPSNNFGGQNVYGMVKKPLSLDHIYSKPYSPNPERKLKTAQMAKAILGRMIAHQKRFDTKCQPNTNEALKENKPLYYMSSPIPDPDISPDCLAETKIIDKDPTANKIPERIMKEDDSTTDILEFQKVRSLLKKVYEDLNTKSNTDSDSDSVASNTDDGSSQEKSVSLTESTSRRKVYVRQMSSCKKFFSPRRKGTNRLFDVLLLIGLKLDVSESPYLKFQYPESASLPHSLKEFCFPDASNWPPPTTYIHTNYTLVLTDDTGDRKYAYCRRIVPEGSNICFPLAYCIITSNKSNGFYYKVLMAIEEYHGLPETSFKQFIHSLYHCKFPSSGESIAVSDSIRLKRPKDWREEYNDLARAINILTLSTFLKIFSTLLTEKKVILISSNVSKLSDCIEGLQTALYPFFWQHSIAILPQSKHEFCESPTPYIFGIVKTQREEPSFSNIDEVFIVDIDRAIIIRKNGDEKSIIPKKLYKCLRETLKICLASEENNRLTSEAIIKFFIVTVGDYRSHLITSPETGKRNFQRESFIKNAESRSLQLFLDWFTETSMFHDFIEIQSERSHTPGIFEERCVEFIEEISKQVHKKGRNKKLW